MKIYVHLLIHYAFQVTQLKNPNPHLPTMPGEESSEEGVEDMDLDNSILEQVHVNVTGTSRNGEKQMPSKKPSKSEENQTPSKKPRRFVSCSFLLHVWLNYLY